MITARHTQFIGEFLLRQIQPRPQCPALITVHWLPKIKGLAVLTKFRGLTARKIIPLTCNPTVVYLRGKFFPASESPGVSTLPILAGIPRNAPVRGHRAAARTISTGQPRVLFFLTPPLLWPPPAVRSRFRARNPVWEKQAAFDGGSRCRRVLALRYIVSNPAHGGITQASPARKSCAASK